jgi:acyl-coenzyme A thioesterase PaaI-like protein
MPQDLAFQDRIHRDHPGRNCFGCGAANHGGLKLKSFQQGDEFVAHWQAQPGHQSYPGYLNGGIASTLIDCHSVCAAFASGIKELGLEPNETPGMLPMGWTKFLKIEFLQPVPISSELVLRARVIDNGSKSRRVKCSIYVNDHEYIKGEATVIMVQPH